MKKYTSILKLSEQNTKMMVSTGILTEEEGVKRMKKIKKKLAS